MNHTLVDRIKNQHKKRAFAPCHGAPPIKLLLAHGIETISSGNERSVTPH